MAQRVVVDLVDDLDESPAVETFVFSLDGMTYEIDLNARHLREIRDMLYGYADHARKTPVRRVRRRPRAVRNTMRSQEIRSWAKAHGLKVSDKGQLPASLVEKYDNRNSVSAPKFSG